MMKPTHRIVNGVSVELLPEEITKFEQEWAAGLVHTLREQLLSEADRHLKAVVQKRIDLAVATALDPTKRPELQRLEDYRAAVKAEAAKIEDDLSRLAPRPWPEQPEYQPRWPDKPRGNDEEVAPVDGAGGG